MSTDRTSKTGKTHRSPVPSTRLAVPAPSFVDHAAGVLLSTAALAANLFGAGLAVSARPAPAWLPSGCASSRSARSRAGSRWTPDEDCRLMDDVWGGANLGEMAAEHGRSRRAIKERLARHCVFVAES